MTEISATNLSSNCSATPLLDLSQLFDKATNAEHYATKTNQEENLCWINYKGEFIIQYNDLIKYSNALLLSAKEKSNEMGWKFRVNSMQSCNINYSKKLA